ncbi:MAG: formate dehydrogenase [Anderseniella sp.]|jgi:nitrous oxide reductase
MAQGKDKAVSHRRDFLKLAGLSAAAGTAAVATGSVAAQAATPVAAGSGYQETDHVKTYYRLAAF